MQLYWKNRKWTTKKKLWIPQLFEKINKKNPDLQPFLNAVLNNEKLYYGENKNIVFSNATSERGFSLYKNIVVSNQRNRLNDTNVKYWTS